MPEVYELANRECREVHRKVSAHKLSHPFQNPVDPVALGLPDYFEKIKHPMDLETIRGKLQRSAYSDGASFVSDMRLIFTNATTYNPPGSDVHIMANVLLEEFERLLKPYVRHVPAAKLAATIASAAPPQPEVEVIPELTSRQMSQLLNSVKRTDEAGWYFSEPVDPEKLGIPDYFAKILHPMDLGTIEKRLEKGMYEDTASFVADVRLVWANAKSYNPPATTVHDCAVKLEDMFERELRKACNGPGANKPAGAAAGKGAFPAGKLTLQTALVANAAPEAVQTNEVVTAVCKPIVAHLRSQNCAKPFNAPVDIKKYPTYLDLVARPMDLKTIVRNLDQHRYATIDDCHADVDLVWNNCRAFNGDNTWVTNNAMTLKAIADPRFDAARHKLASGGLVSPRPASGFKRKLGSGGLTPRVAVVSSNELCCVTAEMRSQLATNAGKLDAIQLRSLMTLVKQCAPAAVCSTSAQSWEVDVDLLDLTSFIKVDTWVRRLLVNKPLAC